MLWTKRAHQCTIFQTFRCSNESSPNFACRFWNRKSGFIKILHHCSISRKITPLYFFSSNLIYFGQKYPIEVKFLGFSVVGWNFIKFLMSYLEPQVNFSLNSASLFSVMRDLNFNWIFMWFLQKEPTKEQNVRFLTAQVKFHQICTLIGYFCWNYIKPQLKKKEGLFLMIPKSGAQFEEKLIFCFKNDKNFVNLDPSTKKSKKCALWLVPFVQSI